MRFFTPVVLLCVAALIAWHNAQSPDEVIGLMFLGILFPSLEADPRALGQASVGLLGLVGGVLLVRAALRRPPEDSG